MSVLVLYCRAGFESECAAEIEAVADAWEFSVQAEILDIGGLAIAEGDVARLARELDIMSLVFTRQWFLGEALTLDPKNRVQGILESLGGQKGAALFIESPDSEQGKELAGLCRAIRAPLEQALKKNKQLQAEHDYRLHVCFVDGTQAYAGAVRQDRSHPEPMGILRLRSPKDAPSRSTLKLEEALQTFIPRDEWPNRLKPKMRCVDLGAAPGGWTYQMVHLGLNVTAIDNGPIDKKLMDSGQVKHLKADGFTYKPERTPVDWLICDMVEKPMRVAQLLAKWASLRWCNEAIVNLKLPMKKRFEETERCMDVIADALEKKNLDYELRAKHLYHDREEITVHVRVLG